MTSLGAGRREAMYVVAWESRQRLLWENYAEGAQHDVARADALLYEACAAIPPALSDEPRRELLERVMTRGRVDFHPEVSELRARLDDPASYAQASSQGEAMESDVLELIDLRDHLAREAGFPSYGHLVMWSERLDLDAVVGLIDSVRREVLPSAVDLVRRHEITIPRWWDCIGEVAGTCRESPAALARELLDRLGLSGVADRLTWVVMRQPISGFSAAVSVPSDVRILLGVGASWHTVGVAFHELGHAAAHSSNRSEGIATTWDTVHDEAMGVVMEKLGAAIMLGPEIRRRLQMVEALETARLATSFLFEVAVNRRPREARQLYAAFYQDLAPIGDPAAWASDSFRSVDPFHVHAYVVGGGIAGTVRDHLRDRLGQDHRGWGRWLVDNLYATGRNLHLFEKLAGAGVSVEPRCQRVFSG